MSRKQNIDQTHARTLSEFADASYGYSRHEARLLLRVDNDSKQAFDFNTTVPFAMS